MKPNLPISSTGTSQPSITSSSGPAAIPGSPRYSTHSTKGIPPVRFTPTKKCYGTLWKTMERSLLFHLVEIRNVQFSVRKPTDL